MLMFKKAVLLCGVALAVFAFAGAAVAADTIGIIDSQGIITKHPGFEEAAKKLQQLSKQKESEAKALADKETDPAKKAQAIQTKRMELAKEEQRLMEPIFRDCQEAVRVVAKKQNVTVVLEKASVYIGGVDITQDVIQQLLINNNPSSTAPAKKPAK